MADNAVRTVANAEREANDRISEANAEAKRIVSDAEKAGKLSLEEAVASAHRRVSETLKAAELGASSVQSKILSQTEEECEKLEALALGKMEKAASVIAERVVGR